MINVICPLVSRDIEKSIRCVNSCRNQLPTKKIKFDVVPIINSLNNDFVKEFSKWCEKEKLTYKITPSKGTPSAGKNQVIEFFKNSNYDGLSMVDGDDMYYPSATQQIERHLLHHPGTDVLIVKPSDQIQSVPSEQSVLVGENKYAVLWGSNTIPMNYKYGPSKHELFENRNAAHNLGGHVFYSKKACQHIKYDEEQILGEDLLLEFELLKLHQEAEISFWLSFASDVQFLDRSDQSNIQSTNRGNGENSYIRLVEKIKTFLDLERSSFQELPVEFPYMIFNFSKKVEWLKEIFTNEKNVV